MKIFIISITFAALSLSIAPRAFASESAELTVSGTIQPQACALTIQNGGAMNFGTISVRDLSDTAPTVLPQKRFTLRIECQAPTRFLVTTVDNRRNTANMAAGDALVRAPHLWYGVGIVDGQKIGAYTIRRTMDYPAIGDGEKAAYLYSLDSHYWYDVDDDHSLPLMRAHAWAKPGTRMPGEFKTIVQPWLLQAAISKKSELPPLTSHIPVDGLMTFVIEYL